MTHIRVEQVKLGYGDDIVVPNLSMEIPQGAITGLIGPNGSGKSTIFRAISRLIQPEAGAVYLDGRAIREMSARQVARELAVLSQDPDVPSGISVAELVAYGRYPHQGLLARTTEADREAVEWALEQTSLQDLRHRRVDTLSGGERQRVWLAVALAQKTDILLLDEPTTYLDIRHQHEILRLVRSLNRDFGITVGWVLHDLNQAAAYSDHLIVLDEGTIFAQGEPAEVLRPDIIRDVFGMDVVVIEHPCTGAPVCLPDEPEGTTPPAVPQPLVVEGT